MLSTQAEQDDRQREVIEEIRDRLRRLEKELETPIVDQMKRAIAKYDNKYTLVDDPIFDEIMEPYGTLKTMTVNGLPQSCYLFPIDAEDDGLDTRYIKNGICFIPYSILDLGCDRARAKAIISQKKRIRLVKRRERTALRKARKAESQL